MTRLQEYEIFVAEEAEEDLNDIYAYISSSYSEDSAADISQRIEREIVSLCVLPKRHRVFYKKLRKLPVGNYQIVYVVDGYTVVIKGVFHTSMDIISRIKGR